MSKLSMIEAFTRWARLKKYRIEVTYGVYVFTPMEKVVFWSIFCFLFSVISFAAILYTQRNVFLLIRYASVYVTREGGASSAVSNLFPKSHGALSVSQAGITSLAETLGAATNSQIP
ncbi:uncharacterized protein F4822DRAFT_112850 [Hypoxylon trugodes]|uniref:uncharacterized protein n=1 Tax=Hypoxylon trugodes TaxID=326681 RepID=UPI002195EDC9|nr:uncharacterized protein F4822DRAFT_112850 [Hypoxylon trugodes]KAI1392008.1 hypothetical protein F4822DRAFT_112850 [Hypoxylon trugodes]